MHALVAAGFNRSVLSATYQWMGTPEEFWEPETSVRL
jgi:hypothetical protein